MRRLICAVLAFALIAAPGCIKKQVETLIVYTSVDQSYAEPIFSDFESRTGIQVLAVYDLESTSSLTDRLITEKNSPVCDVFWDSGFTGTMLLKDKGLLQTYFPWAAQDIADYYKDPEGTWTAFGGNAFVFLVNRSLLAERDWPRRMVDLLNNRYAPEQIAVDSPVSGIGSLQAAAYYATAGAEQGRSYYQALHDRGVRVVAGNSAASDMVASGQAVIACTDNNSAWAAFAEGRPVAIIYPEQEEGGMGTVVAPNTAAIIRGAPHPESAKAFIEYIVSLENETKMLNDGYFGLSVRPGVIPGIPDVTEPSADLWEIYTHLEAASADMKVIFAA